MRTREAHAAIRNPEAYFRAWREAKFGGDFDPIAVAVDEAVAAFSSGKGADGQAVDRAVWLKIANRAGLAPELYFIEQEYQGKRFVPDQFVDITDVMERKWCV